ncbi:SIMPL domain-containing protein [Chloroflexota bacterium]
MKKGLLLVLGLILVLGLVLSGCADEDDDSSEVENASGALQELGALSIGDSSQQTGIWVTGNGKVTVVPDIAVLTMGVEAQSSTVTEAQSDAVAAMTQVMSALKANGVADNDIQTRRFSITPVTKWIDDREEQITIGYRVSNIVSAKVRDIDKTGTIIDAVAEAAGDLTRINSISFSVDDPEPYYDEAREAALLDAIAKAEQIAAVTNVTLGRPTYINEMSSPVPPTPYPLRDGSLVGEAITPISAGELEVSLTVQMVFALQ